MNELHFAHRVRQHLNRGLHDLSPATAGRLEAARELALEHKRIAVHQSALAIAGSYVHRHFDHLHLKQVLAALALVTGIAFYTYWHADQSIAELEAIDSALLADDLPIGALTDKGFDAWLKSSSVQQSH
ncbi:MAG: DUF3619 family protein [Betaproteobacteria bacterium]|nr:DUF3619 family protein [Betaproteobacteria bacterium]